jgi:hypothetical protein
LLDRAPITFDQRFLLRARPALELTLDSNGVGDLQEVLRPDESDGAAGRGLAVVVAGLVLCDASGQIVTGGTSDVK